MGAVLTRVVVRVVSCDAKIIGSLVGGCRVTIRHRDSGETLASGLHLGGAGNTEDIMQKPRGRGDQLYTAEGTACFQAEIPLDAPTPVVIDAEGPLAFPHSLQRASLSTWLVPGEHLEGDGFVLQLHGFIVEILTPFLIGAADLRSGSEVHLQAGVYLL